VFAVMVEEVFTQRIKVLDQTQSRCLTSLTYQRHTSHQEFKSSGRNVYKARTKQHEQC